MLKSELRKIYKEKRAMLTARERSKLDDLLLIRFQQLQLEGVQVLMSYSPSEAHTEPNTYLFTGFLQHMIPGLRLCYPVTDLEALQMKAVAVTDETSFALTRFNVEEPVDGIEIDPKEIDLVFVPMLICDSRGYRVGFGKGFYDRFLPYCRENVIKVGFSYFEPVAHISDTHEFDIPLNYCITPEHVIEY